MKTFLYTMLLLLAAPVAVFAQHGSIVVFSEDGDKFYLVLNGQRFNETAQTRVEVQDMPENFYKGRVFFENTQMGHVEQTFGVKGGTEVTYIVKKKKDGAMTVRYMTERPLPSTPAPASTGTTMAYGQGQPYVEGQSFSQTTTTTTTTTGTPTGDNVNVNMNLGGMGVGMNVNVNGMGMGGSSTTVQQTTTTTTSGSTGTVTPAPAPSGGCSYPMSSSNFQSALASIDKQGFDDTKLSTAKSVIKSNCMTADQVATVCRKFGFEQTKLDFAKYAYQYTYDRNNYFKVNDVFDFDSSVEELNKHTSGN